MFFKNFSKWALEKAPKQASSLTLSGQSLQGSLSDFLSCQDTPDFGGWVICLRGAGSYSPSDPVLCSFYPELIPALL